jgi:hypothetical protein
VAMVLLLLLLLVTVPLAMICAAGASDSDGNRAVHDAHAENIALVKCCLLSGLIQSQLMLIDRQAARLVSNRPDSIDSSRRPCPWQLRWRVPGSGGGSSKGAQPSSKWSEQLLKPHKTSIYSISSSGGVGGVGCNSPTPSRSARKGAAAEVSKPTKTAASSLCVCYGVLSTSRGVAALDIRYC